MNAQADFESKYAEYCGQAETFSEYVWALFQRRKWTARKFADRTHETWDTYYRIKRGELNEPPVRIILSIALGLNLGYREIDDLLALAGRAFMKSAQHFAYQYILDTSDIRSLTVPDFNVKLRTIGAPYYLGVDEF